MLPPDAIRPSTEDYHTGFVVRNRRLGVADLHLRTGSWFGPGNHFHSKEGRTCSARISWNDIPMCSSGV
ncbi:hypothetical protein TRIP_B330107 [uncultured Desulfatiglans sp.]|nr:hypothetical protein TRIP_B330107 [uncultured Desulfatiglans sp.]